MSCHVMSCHVMSADLAALHHGLDECDHGLLVPGGEDVAGELLGARHLQPGHSGGLGRGAAVRTIQLL